MDGTSDDEDEEKMPNGDLSRDLRQDDDDLRDPVNVSIILVKIYYTTLRSIITFFFFVPNVLKIISRH